MEEVLKKLDQIISLLTGGTSTDPFKDGIKLAEAAAREDVENIDIKNKLVWFYNDTPFGRQRWSKPLI